VVPRALSLVFYALRSRTRFRWNGARHVPFSCFALSDSFSAIARASDPDFIICAPGLIFGGTEGVETRFLVLRSRTNFLLYRRRRFPFSCFALSDPFWAVPMASGPIFMFCAPRRIFGGTKGVGSRFHVLRSRTRFRLYRLCRVQFSCFALPDPFSAIPTASGPVIMLCAPGTVLDCTEGVRSRFHVLRSKTRFRRFRARRVPFSCFALPEPFSAVPRHRDPFFLFCAPFSFVPSVSGPVFMFCAFGLISGGTEGIVSRFRRDRRRRVPSSCFALPDPFLAVSTASDPVFMFCADRIIFGGTEGVGSRFYVLRSRTHFRRYRRRQVTFSCFALPDSVFTGTEGVGSCFLFLCSRTRI
jgi:hypothetical protein